MIRTHIETPVQAYIYRLIQLHINTNFSFQDTFAFAFFADYTLIHIFKPIHTHYTLRYASTSIYLYADTVSHCYIYLPLKIHLVLHYLPFTMGLMLIH